MGEVQEMINMRVHEVSSVTLGQTHIVMHKRYTQVAVCTQHMHNTYFPTHTNTHSHTFLSLLDVSKSTKSTYTQQTKVKAMYVVDITEQSLTRLIPHFTGS